MAGTTTASYRFPGCVLDAFHIRATRIPQVVHRLPTGIESRQETPPVTQGDGDLNGGESVFAARCSLTLAFPPGRVQLVARQGDAGGFLPGPPATEREYEYVFIFSVYPHELRAAHAH